MKSHDDSNSNRSNINDKSNIIANDNKLNLTMLIEIPLSSQELMILRTIIDFYSNENNNNKLISILKSNIAIRLIDFFVTNYSKKKNI